MKKLKFPNVELILVLGLAYVFIFFGLQKIVTPLVWLGWTPNWTEGLLGITKLSWTKILGLIEIALGVGLIIPKTRTIATILVVLHLIAVVAVAQFSEIGIRDTGLLLMALALLTSTRTKN